MSSILGITHKMLAEWQSWPLEMKIKKSKQTIKAWYEHYDGKVHISFSGGKDSSVMLHLVRSMYPDVPAVFSNTGLEFPEIVQFVKTIPNVDIVRPSVSYVEVIKKYGYAVISKAQAQYINQGRNSKSDYLKSLRINGGKNGKRDFSISKKWLYLLKAPFEVSEQCCNKLKKDPMKKYEKKMEHGHTSEQWQESRL